MVHKHELHELTMTRTLNKASGLFKFIDFVYQTCWLIYMNISTAVPNYAPNFEKVGGGGWGGAYCVGLVRP